MTTIREEIRNNYPEILSLENIRCILRISKRKASWMLQNGIIKCENNGKKTRQYKVTLDDLFEYLDRLEQANPSVALPVGRFTSRKQNSESKEMSQISLTLFQERCSRRADRRTRGQRNGLYHEPTPRLRNAVHSLLQNCASGLS